MSHRESVKESAASASIPPASMTGTPGLDEVLRGGLTANRLYLVEGDPGAGKTTLALCYLLEGGRQGEPGLYVTLSETKEELDAVARSHGWSLDSINVFELIANEESLSSDSQYTMYHPAETELAETTKAILQEVERTKPRRVVFDSLSELRLLAQDPLRYRRQILALKQFFTGRQCTVLLLDDRTASHTDVEVKSIAHGVISMEQLAPEYGAERRRLRVLKLRGKPYRGGFHDFRIVEGGVVVFPRLIAAEHHDDFKREMISSGVSELDKLLGGGLHRGTSTLIMGPAGSGKSSVAMRYVAAAAARGERVSMFIFDESRATLLARSASTGMDLQPHVDSGRMTIQQIDPAEMPPGEFAGMVRREVERNDCRMIVIDSLNGYLNAMPEERFLTIQLHELLTFLGQKGVTTIIVVAQHGMMGSGMAAPVDVSYLADSVVITRYFELKGRVKKAISVLKKRSGAHESSIREMWLDERGLHLSEPLEDLRGVMTGVPVFAKDGDGHGQSQSQTGGLRA